MSHLRIMKAPMARNGREDGEWPELSHCWRENSQAQFGKLSGGIC